MSTAAKFPSPPPTERTFGLLFGGLFLVAAVRYWTRGFVSGASLTLLLAAIFLVTGLIAPGRLRGLNRAWMLLGELLNRIVSPLVLGAVYFLLFTPLALLLRLGGRDALRRKYAPELASYWVERNTPASRPDSFKFQF